MIPSTELRNGNIVLDAGMNYLIIQSIPEVVPLYYPVKLQPKVLNLGINMIEPFELGKHVKNLCVERDVPLHRFQNIIFDLTGFKLPVKL